MKIKKIQKGYPPPYPFLVHEIWGTHFIGTPKCRFIPQPKKCSKTNKIFSNDPPFTKKTFHPCFFLCSLSSMMIQKHFFGGQENKQYMGIIQFSLLNPLFLYL
jgi:hypothetical protein